MQIYKGKSVFGGIAIGKISVYKKDEQRFLEDLFREEKNKYSKTYVLLKT